MTVTEAITRRCSVRAYKGEPLTDAELNAILEAGLKAPTAANRQELHFTVLKDGDPLLQEIEDEKNRLNNGAAPAANFYYSAPAVVIISGDSSFGWSALDAGIAVENMALAAEELDLGNLIIGCVKAALQGEKKAYFAEKLQFPAGYEYEIAFAVGHWEKRKEPHTYDAAKQISIL